MMPVNDMWRTAQRPVITDLLHERLIRRWLCDRRIVTYTAKGQPSQSQIDSWGAAMVQTAAHWAPNLPYLSLHDLPLTRNLLRHVRDWLDYAESQRGPGHGRIALVVAPDIVPLLRDMLRDLQTETGVFTSYADALAWLKTQA